jgi:hypothetical protein
VMICPLCGNAMVSEPNKIKDTPSAIDEWYFCPRCCNEMHVRRTKDEDGRQDDSSR